MNGPPTPRKIKYQSLPEQIYAVFKEFFPHFFIIPIVTQYSILIIVQGEKTNKKNMNIIMYSTVQRFVCKILKCIKPCSVYSPWTKIYISLMPCPFCTPSPIQSTSTHSLFSFCPPPLYSLNYLKPLDIITFTWGLAW